MSNPLMPVEGIREGTILWFNIKKGILMLSHIDNPPIMYQWGVGYCSKYHVEFIQTEKILIEVIMLLGRIHKLKSLPYNDHQNHEYSAYIFKSL